MTESKRHLLRILANYTRLLTTLGLGIIVVPLTIAWLGDEAFGMISLMGANIGLAAVFRKIIQGSLVRELGSAYHSGDETFRFNYAAICLIAFACTLLSIATFALVILLLPLMQIPDELLAASMWFVAGQGLNCAAMIFLAPMLNMYLVTERFIGYNIWFIGVRMTNIISVLVLGYAIGIKDPATGLMWHGILWSLLGVLGFVIAAAYIYSKDHRLMIRFKGARREALREVFSTFSWNSGVQVVMNMHEQIPPVLLNLFVGPLANAAWGVGFRFVSYIRMATTGIQFGSDAVSARFAADEDSEKARAQLQRLINIQTKLTAMIALPAGIIVFVYGWPIFHLWVGRTLKNYELVMPTAVMMTRILAWAIASRAISETWMIVLYGAGFVKSYAMWIVAGGIIAPIASIILMFTLPNDLAPYAPPLMLTLVFFGIHLLGFPFIAGRCLHIAPLKLLAALLRPITVTLVALGFALVTLSIWSDIGDLGFTAKITADRAAHIDWLWIFISLAVFGCVYTLGSALFVMSSAERQRISNMIRRKRPAKIQGE
ncbi:MAG: lipopolysaccharide biosynthesis protein [Phycisphaerales bacterium JB052]